MDPALLSVPTRLVSIGFSFESEGKDLPELFIFGAYRAGEQHG
jgi:hypothetical protein